MMKYNNNVIPFRHHKNIIFSDFFLKRWLHRQQVGEIFQNFMALYSLGGYVVVQCSSETLIREKDCTAVVLLSYCSSPKHPKTVMIGAIRRLLPRQYETTASLR